jgi:nicotinamidase-related amidase
MERDTLWTGCHYQYSGVNANRTIKTAIRRLLMKPALFIIDMQKEYYKGNSKESMDKASGHINTAIEIFRKKNLPVIWITNEKKEGRFKAPDGFEIIDNFKPDKNDIFIYKNYRNSFNKTNLINVINDNSIDTVIVTGYSAAFCVLSTYRAAEDYDLTPIILKNAIAGDSVENTKFVESISDLVTVKVLEKVC